MFFPERKKGVIFLRKIFLYLKISRKISENFGTFGAPVYVARRRAFLNPFEISEFPDAKSGFPEHKTGHTFFRKFQNFSKHGPNGSKITHFFRGLTNPKIYVQKHENFRNFKNARKCASNLSNSIWRRSDRKKGVRTALILPTFPENAEWNGIFLSPVHSKSLDPLSASQEIPNFSEKISKIFLGNFRNFKSVTREPPYAGAPIQTFPDRKVARK